MVDERSLIARLERSDPDELARLLLDPDPPTHDVLRIHLGDDRYRRMRALALQRRGRRSANQTTRGNVVVLPGIMGSELTAVDDGGDADQIWINLPRIVLGRLAQLRLDDDGREEYDSRHTVHASGILKRTYGEQLLSLSRDWTVRAFWFDWRKSLDLAAAELNVCLSEWFADDAPVHLVAHSMGGLVARTFIQRQPERWRTMWDRDGNGKRGGRLVMLGTPNHGSFAIPQAIVGLEGTIEKLDRIDPFHGREELLTILNSFVGSYQMLPSPLAIAPMRPLYDARTYGDLRVSQAHLTAAREHHELLAKVVDPSRMIYVAGYDRPTFSDITDFHRLDDSASYGVTMAGDGRVTHQLGMLPDVPTYFVSEDHGDLPANGKVLAALDDLLASGKTDGLPTTIPRSRRPSTDAERDASSALARELIDRQRLRDEEELDQLLNRSRSWRTIAESGAARRAPNGEPATAILVGPTFEDERAIAEVLTRGALASKHGDADSTPPPTLPPATTIEIHLMAGSLEDMAWAAAPGGKLKRPVDAIAVGHYLGTKPEGTELAIDYAISETLADARGVNGHTDARAPGPELILSVFAERGTIRGDLGQIFLLSDPRCAPRNGGKPPCDRVIAIAGMGPPGRFGEAELKVLARELCWALGRMGKQHLGTVLIGAGVGNMGVREGMTAWIRGIKNALTGSAPDDARGLRRVTFVERDPDKIRVMLAVTRQEIERLGQRDRLKIELVGPTPAQFAAAEQSWAIIQREQRARRERLLVDSPSALPPTRLTVTLGQEGYRYGAITDIASIPEREVPLDAELIREANVDVAAAWEIEDQVNRGVYLWRLTVPTDLTGQLSSAAPLVLMLDATTARIHWEMMAPPEPIVGPSGLGPAGDTRRGPGGSAVDDAVGRFLGTSRGVTRQLRTAFAPPPDPPPPARRLLRVMVVADPAADNRLVGAEEEGAEVAALFRRFNTVYGAGPDHDADGRAPGLVGNGAEVTSLLGPHEATRTEVMRRLLEHSYDVLHFAGHCAYEEKDPTKAGWIFTGGERITANELGRIDRVPKFVFSNACESGILPERSELRSAGLAPSFADAFFARGVSNLVCTAWPVDDAAAREFALTLYEGLLGLRPVDDERGAYEATPALHMHQAMQQARLKIAVHPRGVRTWGAYQHYGSPYLRFFESSQPRDSAREPAGSRGAARSPPRAKR